MELQVKLDCPFRIVEVFRKLRGFEPSGGLGLRISCVQAGYNQLTSLAQRP